MYFYLFIFIFPPFHPMEELNFPTFNEHFVISLRERNFYFLNINIIFDLPFFATSTRISMQPFTQPDLSVFSEARGRLYIFVFVMALITFAYGASNTAPGFYISPFIIAWLLNM